MVKNIIFDLGNVLIRFEPIGYLRKKISNEMKVQEIFKEVFLSEEWGMLDKGVITEEEAINKICSRSNGNGELIRLAMDNWYEMLTPIEHIVDTLKKLKGKGYKIYYLSNFHELAFEDVTKKYEFFKCFDGGVVSFKEKLLKPEKDIFNKLIERYKIDPKESVFIDDTDENVEQAKKLGFQTIHFKNNIDIEKIC